ncbi:MAG: metallophosphoesterase family protein [Anaerolineae bacterium]
MATIGIVADTHAAAIGAAAAELGGGAAWRRSNSARRRPQFAPGADLLAEIAPVQAVAGNADLFGHGLPLTRLIEIEGKRIGLVHGHGGWAKYLAGKVCDRLGYREEYYVNIVVESFGHVDAIVFGHTHRPHCEVRIECIVVQSRTNRAHVLHHVRSANRLAARVGAGLND